MSLRSERSISHLKTEGKRQSFLTKRQNTNLSVTRLDENNKLVGNEICINSNKHCILTVWFRDIIHASYNLDTRLAKVKVNNDQELV